MSASSPSPPSSRRRLFIGLGVLLVLVGLVAAFVLWTSANDRRASAVEGFARAPVGCDTTLDFIEDGDYAIYLETAGRIDGVRGDCEVEGTYELSGSQRPDVDVVILDPDGQELDTDPNVDAATYDVTIDGTTFAGEPILAVGIDETSGDHVIRVESVDDAGFVVAIGRDPDAGVAGLRAGAIAAGTGGLLVGLILILIGVRRPKATDTTTGWSPAPVPFGPPDTPAQGPPVFGPQSGPTYTPGPPSFPPPPPPSSPPPPPPN